MKPILLFAIISCFACYFVAEPAAVSAGQASRGPVWKPGNGVTPPVAVKQVRPQYTAEAIKAKIQGTVVLECVVETDGTVSEATVTKPLDPGLDEVAVKALRQWRLKPGTKDGKAVRVRVSLEMTFTLRK